MSLEHWCRTTEQTMCVLGVKPVPLSLCQPQIPHGQDSASFKV